MDAPERGLCHRCRHAQLLGNERGSRFLRCGRSDSDPAYRRYPPLPVAACDGFGESSPAGSRDTTRGPAPPVTKGDGGRAKP